MSIDSALARGRRSAEARMVDSCTIATPAGKPVYDPVTGTTSATPGAVVYAGRCEVKVPGLTAQEAQVGGTEVGLRSLVVKLPITVTGVRKDHVVTMDAAANDPDLVGRTFRVESAEAETYATCRRLVAEEVS